MRPCGSHFNAIRSLPLECESEMTGNRLSRVAAEGLPEPVAPQGTVVTWGWVMESTAGSPSSGSLSAGRRGGPPCGASGRRLRGREGEAGPAPRRLPCVPRDCKFATLDQCLGALRQRGQIGLASDCALGVWFHALPRQSREKLWRRLLVRCRIWCSGGRVGTAGVGDVLNGARA